MASTGPSRRRYSAGLTSPLRLVRLFTLLHPCSAAAHMRGGRLVVSSGDTAEGRASSPAAAKQPSQARHRTIHGGGSQFKGRCEGAIRPLWSPKPTKWSGNPLGIIAERAATALERSPLRFAFPAAAL